MTSKTAEPPLKKRRSKWDVVATKTETSTTGAAAVAAAKINAMLAAKGKLAKSDNVFLPPTTPTPALGMKDTNTLTVTKTTLLTSPLNVAPLYSTPPPSGHLYIQEKVFVGLEEASKGFSVADKLKGQNNNYLTHISAQTGGKAFLRGKGSGYIEPTSGKESFEALHIFISHTTQDGVDNARKLCQSLIDTVKKDYELFKSSQSGPLGFGGVSGYSNNTIRPIVNPYSLCAPGYSGYSAPHPDHPPYYGIPQGPPQCNYPPPPGPVYPPPPGPGGYYGPPHSYPPPTMPYPPIQDLRSGPPNAFTDYRTYDKVAVTASENQTKRKFTEETVNDSNGAVRAPLTEVPPISTPPLDPLTKPTKRSFTDSLPTTGPSLEVDNKRNFSDEVPIEAPMKRRFTEEKADAAQQVVNEKPPEPVGKWESLSQPAIIKPIDVAPSNSCFKPLSKEKKGAMPPPTLPGGLKGTMLMKPQTNSHFPAITSANQHSSGQEENPSKPPESKSKAPGLSLLAHYDDDSDSDNDG